MNLNEYIKSHTSLLSPRTVSFLIKEEHVLLGYKKTRFGKGNYIGIGGKVEKDETVTNAARREVKEEIGIHIGGQTPSGSVNFYFPKESWNQKVHIFLVTSWEGEPTESEEIKPKWFHKDALPFTQMWDDAKFWIPNILKGEKIQASFLFNEKLLVIDHSSYIL